MIVSAAVKIKDLRQNKEFIMRCHRHVDIYEILYNFGYTKNDYIAVEGFLDDEDNFLDRVAAKRHAWCCDQVHDMVDPKLYSEEIW